jgi:hypothetical protein
MDAATMAVRAGAATAGMAAMTAEAVMPDVAMRGVAMEHTAMPDMVTLEATLAAVRLPGNFMVTPVADSTAAALAGSTVEAADSTEVGVDVGN